MLIARAPTGASKVVELAVATAISPFGLTSGATLATVVDVLVEVPVMRSVGNRTRHWFAPVAPETAGGRAA